ncbi:protein DENND6B isoform X3 [Ovis canadensis]|uniref:protein DENND6B isoform X3 n=1 Tax=Ovis canadensis TaxID=37174 RepID=UPI0037522F1B
MDLGAGAGAGPKPARGRLGAPSSGMRAPGTPWARFSAWLECVCVVTFDLELGQALELVYPSDFQLTDKEKSSICYLSFPDSHSGCLGDTQFSFRIRQCGGQRRPGHAGEKHGDSGAPASLQREPAHYFGYVYFRQVKDSSVKRGYFQKVSPGVAPLGAGGSCHQKGLTALGSGASRSTPSSAALGTWCWAEPTTTQAGVWALWRPCLALPGPQPCPAQAPCPSLNWDVGGAPHHHLDDFSLELRNQSRRRLNPRETLPESWPRAFPKGLGSSSLCCGGGLLVPRQAVPETAILESRWDALPRQPWRAGPPTGWGGVSPAPGSLQSLVLLSRLPFVRLFQALLGLVAPEFFDKLAPCLEAVCNEIDQWPAPAPGRTLSLPVMGVVLQVHIPSRADTPEPGPPEPSGHETLLPAPVVLPSVHELDLFRCFRPVLAHVQLLWELMLLGEPLLVLAPSPAVSSEMVLALTSCLQPLKFCCDYRPYFTIHDSEFKEFTTRTQAPPNVVLGVTNPFFIKTLQHWPHILRVGEPKTSGDLPKQVKLKKPSRLKTLDTKPGPCSSSPPGTQRQALGAGRGGQWGWHSQRGCPHPQSRARGPLPSPGLYTAYTAHLHRDKALFRRLLKGLQKKRPSDVQTAVLRRHLLELTQSFIIPLEHYMASLMPLQKGIVPWKTPPQIRPFRQDDFLHNLERSGPQLTCVLKGDWLGLYRWAAHRRGPGLPRPVGARTHLLAHGSPQPPPPCPDRRFFKSPHFDGWYRQRRREMAQKLEALHLEAICEANIELWMKDKSEVEVVDLILKLRERLVRAQGHQLPVKEATLKRARLYIDTAIGSLPKDLQAVLCPP